MVIIKLKATLSSTGTGLPNWNWAWQNAQTVLEGQETIKYRKRIQSLRKLENYKSIEATPWLLEPIEVRSLESLVMFSVV